MTKRSLFTSEQVTPGHPDRLTDNIVENVYAEILHQDPNARVALEGLLAKGFLTLAGEITTDAYVDFAQIARETVLKIGYDDPDFGLDGNSMGVLVSVNEQSSEIAGGVFNSYESREAGVVDDYDLQGAGDQGIVFGGAIVGNDLLHPASHRIATLLAEKLYDVRTTNPSSPLRPDGKTQVTLELEDGVPIAINAILISTQHHRDITLAELREYVREVIIKPVIAEYNSTSTQPLADKENYIINPAGEWNMGASAADVGLVGRKIIADTTGGWFRFGGGNLNGKDFSKVDRSGVYAARHAAKNLVAAGVADHVEIQIGYAIGVAQPMSVLVETFGTAHYPAEKIDEIVEKVFDFRPLAIKELLEPEPEAYQHTALFGHLGRNPQGLFNWERLDKVDAIKGLL